VYKHKPAWQRFKFNGIGGKVEPGETAEAAMRREFLEEAGLDLDWQPRTQLVGPDFVVYFFTAFSNELYNIRTIEKEEIVILDSLRLPGNVIFNLNWIIPMFLDNNVVVPEVIHTLG
jgi:8-oxo-dGTP diphosphatase